MNWFRRTKQNRRVTAESPAPNRLRPAFAGLVAGLIIVAAGSGAAMYLREVEWEHFRALEVTGDLERISAREVHVVLQPFIASGFARIDMRAAQDALESLPWIADAKVRRQWPATLAVEVREERPVATWFGTSLMNARGEVFVDGAAGFSGTLPDVGGPAGTQQAMIRRLDEVRDAMRAVDADLRRLLRTERRAERLWLGLDDGRLIEVRLGRHDADARLQRFLQAAWPALAAESDRIDYIDMRYTNGFAVGWKATAPESPRERG